MGAEGNVTETRHLAGKKLQMAEMKLRCVENVISKAEQREKCLSGWTLVNEKCYFFSEHLKTKEESNQFCVLKESTLATVKSENTMLQSHIKRLNSAYWIGLDRERRARKQCYQWYWPDGSVESSLPTKYIAVNCAKMDQRLRTEPCSSRLRWICEKEMETFDLGGSLQGCFTP
ncbi:killer cell lectin-like receptor subfamily F member 1 [Ascaphus truei]|uniref:killer cell lectin-like receptor subfamily F member 1 n=1 Tax=Ascaphus truei TaxID=8439 RepID=UPI003F59DCA0